MRGSYGTREAGDDREEQKKICIDNGPGMKHRVTQKRMVTQSNTEKDGSESMFRALQRTLSGMRFRKGNKKIRTRRESTWDRRDEMQEWGVLGTRRKSCEVGGQHRQAGRQKQYMVLSPIRSFPGSSLTQHWEIRSAWVLHHIWGERQGKLLLQTLSWERNKTKQFQCSPKNCLI